jgi:hypothetical protein
MQTSAYQANRQQLLLMGSTIFVSVTAAVIVSTLLIMSLMRGEIASALSSNVQNSSPVSQVASTCVEPQAQHNEAPYTSSESHASVMPMQDTGGMGNVGYVPTMKAASYHYAKPAAPTHTNNSYNSTNVNNTTTTNNVTNTDNSKNTHINDSFNKDSYNDNSKGSHNPIVIKDNEVNVNSNNTKNIDSNNTTNVNKTTNNTVDTINHNSNNTTNSNNSVDILSDNKVIIPVIPAVVPTV